MGLVCVRKCVWNWAQKSKCVQCTSKAFELWEVYYETCGGERPEVVSSYGKGTIKHNQ